jgi:hypothetical protein
MDASAAHTLAVLAGLEPLGWLIVLVALYFGGERRQARLSKAGLGQHQSQGSEAPATNYRPLAVLVVLKFLTSLSYPIFQERLFPLGISVAAGHLAYRVVFWGSYFAVTVCVFFVIGSLLKNSLSPLPGLSSAAMIVFRWAAGLAFALAATAHIPVFGIHSWFLWLNEVSVSFALCVCTFEISLLVLMLSRMGKLGMCLRSRPVGLAVGLTLLGFMDLTSALTLNLSTVVVTWVARTDLRVIGVDVLHRDARAAPECPFAGTGLEADALERDSSEIGTYRQTGRANTLHRWRAVGGRHHSRQVQHRQDVEQFSRGCRRGRLMRVAT